MNKELTFGQLIAILIPVFAGAFVWGKNMETTQSEHTIRLEQLERTNVKVEAKLDDIGNDITKVLVELQNKVDEKK